MEEVCGMVRDKTVDTGNTAYGNRTESLRIPVVLIHGK